MTMTQLPLFPVTRNLQQMYSNFCQKFKNVLTWNTEELLLSDHSRGRDSCPLNRGGHLKEVHPKTTLGVVLFSVYQIEIQTNASGVKVEQ